jgi:hypothetical protein
MIALITPGFVPAASSRPDHLTISKDNRLSEARSAKQEPVHPEQAAVAACMAAPGSSEASFIYSLPPVLSGHTLCRSMNTILNGMKNTAAAKSCALSPELTTHLEKRLAAAAILLLDSRAEDGPVRCSNAGVKENCVEAFVILSGQVRQQAFVAGDNSVLVDLLARTEALATTANLIRTPESTVPPISDEMLQDGAVVRQLDQWRKGNDIGGEVMRLFVSALIRLREGMRASRQMAFSLYSYHADLAIAALQKQGDENWKKEILSAIGMMVSGVLQLVPIAVPMISSSITKFRSTKAFAFRSAKSNINKTDNAQLSPLSEKTGPDGSARNNKKNTQAEKVSDKHAASDLRKSSDSGIDHSILVSERHIDIELGIKQKKTSNDVKKSDTKKTAADADIHKSEAKVADAAKDTDMRLKDRQARAEQATHTGWVKQQVYISYYRALGELVQGSFNIGAAMYGRSAAYLGAEHYSQNAEMQKQLFQREVWNSECDTLTRTKDQVESIISDLQTRQTDTTSKIIGRA